VFDEPSTPQNTEGLAQVRVNIGSNARTILPNFDWVFSKYELSAAPATGNTQNAPPPVERNGDNNWITIGVPSGEWTFTVTAFVKVGGTDYPAATGSAHLEVSGDTKIDIALNTPKTGGTGTFSYKATYPTGGSAQVKLESWPLGTGSVVVINNTPVNNGVPASSSVPSGIYFLTVTATANSRTVIRNEIVHIYQRLTTNANYIFSKLDFGAESLQISGTVSVLLNGQQPDRARVIIYDSDDYSIGDGSVTFTGNDGSGTWSAEIDNLHGADTLYFQVLINGIFYTETIHSIPVPVDNISGINLGPVTIDIDFVPLNPDAWTDGNNTSYKDDWYTFDVNAGDTYYVWWNAAYEGDGSKTSYILVQAYHDNGNYLLFSQDGAWDNPAVFTADTSGTVYLKVRAWYWDKTGTYAITYSTNPTRPY
jgi:hypothetical protein